MFKKKDKEMGEFWVFSWWVMRTDQDPHCVLFWAVGRGPSIPKHFVARICIDGAT